MNDSTRVISRPRRARPAAARTAVAVIATAGLALLAACGGSPSSTGAGASPSGGGTANSPSALAFAACMRSHGVPDFPDPGQNPVAPGSGHGLTPQQLGVSNSQLQGASAACRDLNPKSRQTRSPLTAQEQQDYLRAAACMRSHDITNFPDPTFAGGQVNFAIPSGMQTTSPQFTRALRTCQKLIPAGLPYSGSGG